MYCTHVTGLTKQLFLWNQVSMLYCMCSSKNMEEMSPTIVDAFFIIFLKGIINQIMSHKLVTSQVLIITNLVSCRH